MRACRSEMRRNHLDCQHRLDFVVGADLMNRREYSVDAVDTVGGEAYLVRVAKNHPQVFCMLLARILPLQVSSRDGVPVLPAPAPKIAETLELLRSRLGDTALQQSVIPRITN